MKYTTPVYSSEKIETADVMVTSTVAVAYVEKEIENAQGVKEKVTATQVTVDVSGLFSSRNNKRTKP